MSNIETRTVPITGGKLEGYAAVFGQPSRPLPMMGGKMFTEVVRAGAFAASLAAPGFSAALLWGHDQGRPLASTRSGTLVLAEDSTGLRFSATLPDTSDGRDARALVGDGVLDQMSFGFVVDQDEWRAQERTLVAVTLHEVSLTHNPAYPQTSAAMRSYERNADARISGLRLRLWRARRPGQ